MAQYKRGRRRHCGMGGLVQQPSIARSLPRQATGRVRDPVRVGRPDQPGRLTPTTSLYRTQGGSRVRAVIGESCARSLMSVASDAATTVTTGAGTPRTDE